MRFRGHGSAVAIAVATVALVAAGTGTAVAVSSTVNIADPANPARVAHVDPAGRLTTVGATSTIAVSVSVSTVQTGAVTALTSPTTATLAITRVAVGNPHGNDGATNADYGVVIQRFPTTGGACSTAGGTTLLRFDVAPGDYREASLPEPLIVKPTGTAPYCVAAYGYTDDGGADDGPYYAWVDLSAYVAGGKYSGIGTGAPTPAVGAAHDRKK